MPWQRLNRLGAKIKLLKIKVFLYFTIKISKLPRKISRDSVPKDSASIANRVFKKLRIKTRDDYVITPSKTVCNARFICQIQIKRAAGASPINTLWNNLINRSL